MPSDTGCPRCHAREPDPQGCVLCAAQQRFTRRLGALLAAMTGLTAILFACPRQLREVVVYRRRAAPVAAPRTPPPEQTPPPAPEPEPPVASAPAAPPPPELPSRQFSATELEEVLPGVAASRVTSEGWQVPEVDEADLRDGKRAAEERAAARTQRATPSAAPVEAGWRAASAASAAPEPAGWDGRLAAVIRESLAGGYAPDGISLRTGFSPGGLVYWVFHRLGVRGVPQLVDDQMEMAGERLAPEGYRPRIGDLLFFAIGKVHQVGIYFDAGQNTFVTVIKSKGGVVAANFDHPFFRQRFLFARRIPAPR